MQSTIKNWKKQFLWKIPVTSFSLPVNAALGFHWLTERYTIYETQLFLTSTARRLIKISTVPISLLWNVALATLLDRCKYI